MTIDSGTDWGRVRDNMVALLGVLAWAAQADELDVLPEEYDQLPAEDQDEILAFLEGAATAVRQARGVTGPHHPCPCAACTAARGDR